MEKAIVLLSGGLNSAVAAAEVRKSHDLYMLFVNFLQRPLEQEQKAYQALCEHFEAKHHWKVDLTHFRQVGGNALVDPKRDIEHAETLERDTAGTFVGCLMPTLFDVAGSFAYRIGARSIISGVSQAIDEPPPGNRVLYPDNNLNFIQNYQYALEAALPKRSHVAIKAPLIDFDRAEIIKLARRLKVPMASTWSCYNAEETPCGTCYGCASRAAGFLRVGIPDPRILPTANVD